MGTDQAIEAKWGEVAAAVERLAERSVISTIFL